MGRKQKVLSLDGGPNGRLWVRVPTLHHDRDTEIVVRVYPPPHFNPPPMFGLRPFPPSPTHG